MQGAGLSATALSATQLAPPTTGQPPSAPSQPAQPSNEQSQNQLQRLLQALAAAASTANSNSNTPSGSSINASPASAAAAGVTTAPSVDTAALTRSLAGVVAQLSRSGQMAGAGLGIREPQLPPHSLLDVLQPDRVIPLLADDDIKQLVQLLPGDDADGATATAADAETAAGPVDTADSASSDVVSISASTATATAAATTSLSARVSRHMRSAQFQQTVGRMQSLLHSENYGSLLGSLGLDTAAGGFGVEGLVAAIERQVQLGRDSASSTAATANTPATQ